jgi:hypothetical protein
MSLDGYSGEVLEKDACGAVSELRRPQMRAGKLKENPHAVDHRQARDRQGGYSATELPGVAREAIAARQVPNGFPRRDSNGL